MKWSIAMLAMAVALWAAPVFAQHGHAPMGAGNGMGHGNMSANKGSGAGSSHGVTIDQQLKNNKTIAKKISDLTQEPATQACQGFKNLGQCVAAAHVSQNLGIKFDCLHFAMTGVGTSCSTSAPTSGTTKTMSLGTAIHSLSPTVNAGAESKKAKKQADQDLNDSNNS
ncbi:MAG TPA: hypothetical protein VFJ47_16910 [Terriglobales bacterium]|nr:hypothetical protein [Terriglobales bacterium]